MISVDCQDTLEYITVDSIQWATGYKRPRMSAEERRIKHRKNQKSFVERQRERMEDLRATVRRLRLVQLILEAKQEAARLSKENATMRCEQLAAVDYDELYRLLE